ncbi:hypothetical protein TNCV_1020421 [Trichonephila clavipes]|nr:hypothetical protein TNCV_1020421 [Trichonephila clavipes]
MAGRNTSFRCGISCPTPSLSSYLAFRRQGSFAMREKGGNCLVPGPDYVVDALKLPNQAPRVSGESLQKCVGPSVVLMEHNTSSVDQFWPFLVNC